MEGQKAYVAEVGEVFSNAQGRRDARLRVIFDNGTESNMLMRSLQRALHKDAAGRRITDPAAGPLFGSEPEQDDLASGTIQNLGKICAPSLSFSPPKLIYIASKVVLHRLVHRAVPHRNQWAGKRFVPVQSLFCHAPGKGLEVSV